MKKTYVISHEAYMHEDAGMHSFVGTQEELMQHLMPGDYSSWEEFQESFEEANGDGQAYISVFCVEDNIQVLGNSEDDEQF